MSLNTLATAVSGIVKALHVNNIVSALVGAFVGRNSSGAPASGQDLGTLLYPWGTGFVTDINYRGTQVAPDVFDSSRNRIVQGQTRSTSGQPDFIRAAGSTNAFTIEASVSAPLELVINDVVVEITSDIVVTGLTVAPAANNTALVDEPVSGFIIDQEVSKYFAEDDSYLIFDSVGSEISDRQGLIVSLSTVNGEIMYTQLEDDSASTDVRSFNAYRGYYFDDSGDPIPRDTLDNNDMVTLFETGWIFIKVNGSTVEVSYITPIVSGVTPLLGLDGNALIDGQYWFDLDVQTWKRYSTSSVSFETLDMMLIGLCVMDGSNCVATRSFYPSKSYDEFNNIDLVRPYEIGVGFRDKIRSRTASASISVYGTTFDFLSNYLIFDPSTDMESGVSLTASTKYYLYLTEEGVPQISDIRFYKRDDLRGNYHPYNSWRSVGEFYYSSGSDVTEIISYKDNNLLGLTYAPSIASSSPAPQEIATPINTKVIKCKIGSWDMVAAANASVVVNGLEQYTQRDDFRIKEIEAWIFHDTSNIFYPLKNIVAGAVGGGLFSVSFNVGVDAVTISLGRTTGGVFDDAAFNDATINRGYLFIEIQV